MVPFPAGDKDFVLFFETFRPSVGSHSCLLTVLRGLFLRGSYNRAVKLTAHLRLVPRVGMRGTVLCCARCFHVVDRDSCTFTGFYGQCVLKFATSSHLLQISVRPKVRVSQFNMPLAW